MTPGAMDLSSIDLASRFSLTLVVQQSASDPIRDMPQSGGSRYWTAGDRFTLELVLFVLCWAVAALLFAVVGWFHWWLVVPVSLAGFSLSRRFTPKHDSGLDIWWWAAVAIAVVTLIVNGLNPGEHLLTGRDSGTYMATAGWLAEESTLIVEAETGSLAGVDGLEFVLPGFYEWAEGREGLEPQFMHAFPAMLGTLIDIAGISASFWLNPVFGGVFLLALFALARRFMRPWAALLAMSMVATSLIFLYFARTPFTEVLMAMFAVTGFLTFGEAERQSNTSLGVLAGALIGATVLARIDGIVLLIPVVLYFAVQGRSRPESARLYGSASHAVLFLAILGIAESLFISPAYIMERIEFVASPLLVVVALMVGNDFIGDRLAETWRNRIAPFRQTVFISVVVVAALLLTFAWMVRPNLDVPEQPRGGDLAFVEARESLDTNPRNYHAYSVQWVTWYQGHAFVVLGFLGAVFMARDGLNRRLAASSWLVPLSLVVFSVLYFWRPSISPDHIWAMRRYLTAVIPLGALTAALAVDRMHGWAKDWRVTLWFPNFLSSVLVLSLLVPTVSTSAPVWDAHEYEGLTDDVNSMCDDLGDETTVLVVDYALAQYVVQGFRSYCGISAGWVDSAPETEINRVKEQIASTGQKVAVVILGDSASKYLSGDYERLEITLSYPPSRMRAFPISLSVSP